MTQKMDFEMKRRTVMKLGMGAAALATVGINLPTAVNAAEPAKMKHGALGTRMSRAEGALKVSGHARYAIEQKLDNLAYGVVVQSTQPAGRVTSIDVTAAKAAPGVLEIYTPQNPLKLGRATAYSKGGGATEEFTPLQDDVIRFNGQHIAIVIAETFEQATEAAHLVKARVRGWRADL